METLDSIKILLSMIFLIASIVTCKIAWQNSETGTEFLIAYFTHPFYLIGVITGGVGLLL